MSGGHRRRTGGDPGDELVTVVLSYDQAVALTRCIVRYLSRPESPLLPPAEERLVLAAYDAIVNATVPAAMRRPDEEWRPGR
jgi:hypothetical protein